MNPLQTFLTNLYIQLDSYKICPICNNPLIKTESPYLYSDEHIGVYYNKKTKLKMIDIYINNKSYYLYPFDKYYQITNPDYFNQSFIDISNLNNISINGLINFINKYNTFK